MSCTSNTTGGDDMILYKLIPWAKEDEDIDFSPCTSWREAQELGNTYFPKGYDIEEIDTEED